MLSFITRVVRSSEEATEKTGYNSKEAFLTGFGDTIVSRNSNTTKDQKPESMVLLAILRDA